MNLLFSFTLLSCLYLNGCSATSSAPGPSVNPTESPKVGASQDSSQGRAVFEPVLTELKQKTRVPLRLPTYLATEEETNPLYAIIETATVRRYVLQLAFTKTCGGGTACRYGMVSGQAVEGRARREKGRAVSLAHGITGYFVDAQCGANCSDSTLTWVQDGYRYTVGIKAEKVETLIKVANSAIESKLR